MSVLIKGMEMPKNCFMCYLSRLNGERLFCNVTGEEVLRYKIAPECPMTEATERKRGKWKRKWDHRNGFDYAYEVCSECGAPVNVCGYDYCPNCGADMREETEDIPMEYFESGGK